MQPPMTLQQMTKKRSVSIGLPGPDHRLPPAGLAGDRVDVRDVLVAGQRMADQHRVATCRRSACRRSGRRSARAPARRRRRASAARPARSARPGSTARRPGSAARGRRVWRSGPLRPCSFITDDGRYILILAREKANEAWPFAALRICQGPALRAVGLRQNMAAGVARQAWPEWRRNRHRAARRQAAGARRSAGRDRPHRRGDAPAPDGARRHHRPADRASRRPRSPGSAFRPGREASMMRALAERHARPPAARHGGGHLARHHRHLHLCAGAVRGPCRHLGRRRADARHRPLPLRLHGALSSRTTSAAAVIDAVAAARRRPRHLPPRPGRHRRAPGGATLAGAGRPKIIARLPFIERPDHPAGTPVFVVSKPLADAAVRDVVLYAAQLRALARGRSKPPSPASAARSIASAGDARGLSVLLAAPGQRVPGARRRAGEAGARRRRPRRDRQPRRAFPREIDAAKLRQTSHADPRPLRRPGRDLHDGRLARPRSRIQHAPVPCPAPACWRSRPMCRARAARPASPRSTSCPRTRRRSGRRPQAIEACGAPPSELELYPDGTAAALREAIAREATASIRRASSAARARTSS